MSTLREALELIYFITAGPGLLIAAIIGLRSLKLSKEAMSLSERRARLTATSQQIENFATVIAPLVDSFDAYIKKHNVLFFQSWNVHLTPEGVAVERTSELENMDDFIASLPHYMPIVNALSAWSSYFTIGVADEEVAYKTLCADFIHACDFCIPAVLVLEKTHAHADMLSLYETWRGRFEQENLVEDIQDSLTRVQELHAISRRGKAR